MGYPRLSYFPADGASLVTLDFKRGPLDFICPTDIRAKDNVSTSGKRERVFEAQDLLIKFTMPAIYVYDDYPAWSAFEEWAMNGKNFSFSPNSSRSTVLTCVSDDTSFAPSHKGVGWYECSCAWRIVPDPLCPPDPGVVMAMFYALLGLVMLPVALPAAAVGSAYSQQLSIQGSASNYAWSVVAGALPIGMSLAASGLLSGTPTAAGTSPFFAGAVLLGSDDKPVWTAPHYSDQSQNAYQLYNLAVSA